MVIWQFPALGGLEYVSQKDIWPIYFVKMSYHFNFLYSLLIPKLHQCFRSPAFKVLYRKQKTMQKCHPVFNLLIVFKDLCDKQ